MALEEKPTIFLYVNDQQTGPHTVDGIRTMARQGLVPEHAQYWQEGMTEWAAVSDLLG